MKKAFDLLLRQCRPLIVALLLCAVGVAYSQTGLVNSIGVRLDGANRTQVVGPDVSGTVPTGNPLFLGQYDGTNVQPFFYCPNTSKLNALGAATSQIVALAASTKIRICSAVIDNNSATATNVKFVEGTGANCGTGQADLTASIVLGANTLASDNRVISLGPGGAWTTNTAGDAVCVTGSAAGSVEVTVTWARF